MLVVFAPREEYRARHHTVHNTTASRMI
jgi:hypothetical protein